MADFVAVLRKTVDALGDNTPEMREKVFEKARATIEAKLKAIQPPPPQMVVDRQRKALEDAIAVIRADYSKTAPESDETLEDIFASLKSLGEAKPAPRPQQAPTVAPPPLPASPPVAPAAAVQAERSPYEPSAVSRSTQPAAPQASPIAAGAVPAATDPWPVTMPKAPDPSFDAQPEEIQGPPTEDGVAPAIARPVPHVRRERRVGGGLIAAGVAVVVLAAGGYGIWANRSDLATMVGLGSGPAGDEGAATTASDLPPPEPAQPDTAGSQTEASEDEVAALPPAVEAEPEAPAPAEASGEPVKFTQRLMPDGSEIDEGPAGGPRNIGEGTSVAAATPPTGTETATDASPGGDGASPPAAGDAVAPTQTSAPAAAEQSPAVAVGQRAIFYEERTSSASGSAEVGNIVWSTVQESPGGDLPPEPAIRAEAIIPGKDIQLRMTIRRNADQTLPASHIIEMIFLTPDGFEGGAISNVTRISFKETEQAAGNALIGIPAKIADGFFLIALGSAPAEVEANTALLRRQSWIDVPITYQSGRRALLSMEKGIPGDKVFQDTLRAWAEASSG